MIAIPALLFLAIAIGCAAMWKPVACLQENHPRWAVLTLIGGAGAAFGIGATSILFFVVQLIAPGMFWVDWIVEIAALGWLIFEARRVQVAKPVAMGPNLVATGALLAVIALSTFAMTQAWELHPFGNWDAWSIWNLRAKFLLAGKLAWSPLLANTHPEYPLLHSGAVARLWAAGGLLEIAPKAIGYTFFLALLAIVTGGIAIARGSLAGLIAGVTLGSTATLIDQAPTQYADVPIAAFFAAAAIFVMIERPIWAGVFAGFALWTKDEGAMFGVLLLAVVAMFRMRRLARVAIGMIPGAAVYFFFKIALAPHVAGLFGAGTFSRLMNGGRWGVVLGGMLSQVISLGASWMHPALILIVYAIGVRLRVDSRRDAYMWTALAAATIAGYGAVMVAQSNDVLWQVNTAADRLVLQWWPLAIIAVMMWLRPAEELTAVEASRKKRK